MLDEYRALDNWLRCEVEPQSLRDMHGTFRDEPLCKGMLFSRLLDHFRTRIEQGDFPFATDIRAPWSNKPPIVVARTINTGELYVADGEKRVFNACYHKEPSMQALVVHVLDDWGVVDNFSR